jgi:predicted 3-demethylubiquinone-9 3-methyltransferase (glyoxalase superfamily)
MSKSGWFLGVIAVSQLAGVFVAGNRATDRIAVTKQAAAEGRSTFQLTGSNVTMINGHADPDEKYGCAVNLVYTDNGDFVKDWSGLIMDDHPKPARVWIKDCRKLPKQVFLSPQNE